MTGGGVQPPAADQREVGIVGLVEDENSLEAGAKTVGGGAAAPQLRLSN